MRKRTQAREETLKILYQAEIIKRDIPAVSQNYWKSDEPVDDEVVKFANRLVQGINEHLTVIDEKVAQYATNWQLKRMAIIDRNVLRIGTFELLFAPDIPPKVTINEAVELAKKYGDLDSSKFVNGILDKIHKREVVPSEGKAQDDEKS
jgi:transcription antitermination factor NusB